ncbi:uncharacterized protein LOC128550594 [Mercenaria mercenaria]|uniref:uncharacterized protein LOC128550594 n=1 Tax=Mercenaria mercenaria TaxID=6596 RepID=UPI00234E702D|nr:uncharacterized protein LOC128550594 [Mercenaria mercenaria]
MPAVSLCFPTCKKYEIVSDIAKGQFESHPEARQCTSGNKTSHEAFILVNCDAGSPQFWKKGASVMSSCDTLPSYTPIAAIKNGSTEAQTEWELSGIFIGCVSGGFKMSYQNCDTKPTIVHIESGNGTGIHDPYNYFVIVSWILYIRYNKSLKTDF